MIRRLRRAQVVPAPLGEVWEFFCDPRNLDAITPPELRFTIVSDPLPRMHQGQLIEYRVGFLPGLSSRWLTEIRHVRDEAYFVDEQRVGPYRLWYHEHHFRAVAGGVEMRDEVTYQVGFGPLGDLLAALWIDAKLARIFDFRAAAIARRFPGT